MKEESQIDEMRAALRGDRERAEHARQRSTENVLGLIARTQVEQPPAEQPPAEQPPAEQPPAEPPPRRGLVRRLLGR